MSWTTAAICSYQQLLKEQLNEIEEDVLVFKSPLRPTVFTADEVARAAVLPPVIPAPRLIRRAPLQPSNEIDWVLIAYFRTGLWPRLGELDETAIVDDESSDEEEELEQCTTTPKKCAKDQVKSRTHQKSFLDSLQPTPAALHKTDKTKRRFDDSDRLAWLQRETYIEAGSIEKYSVVCGCCAERQKTKPKAKNVKRSGGKNGWFSPAAWIAHRKLCPSIYKTWIEQEGLTDEKWSFRR